ncbi:ribonuclease M5 [Alkalicoccus urumqiensis]|uniref:Ribonuclease M5 n=1 Tax=Alkalicoccus urumqiensis TaxID=1548213 RepID=A0A2P6MDN5_ALKUR|nr:ribonuclease M5 [Alkalicoccus urumqiensis]PRO64387.1 ribonuclease M5 [Alkalicoccus urumqiensis]
MERIHEMIVVEGKNDTHALKRAFDCDTIETSGSGLRQDVIESIRRAKERRGVIIFTDPDFPGQQIRHRIDQAVPGCSHAFLPKYQAVDTRRRKVGIEHASVEDLQRAVAGVKKALPESVKKEVPSWQELHEAGFLAGPGARKRRERLGELLHIGYTNGKQLVRRMEQFQVSREEFYDAVRIMEEEND